MRNEKIIIFILLIIGLIRILPVHLSQDIQMVKRIPIAPDGRVFLSENRFSSMRLEVIEQDNKVRNIDIKAGLDINSKKLGMLARHHLVYVLSTLPAPMYQGQILQIMQKQFCHTVEGPAPKKINFYRQLYNVPNSHFVFSVDCHAS